MISYLTADSKVFETEAKTHASRGLVKETMLEMQSSGKVLKGDKSVTISPPLSPLGSTP